MSIDNILSLADSKDVALLLSLFANFILGWALKKVYQAKEKLQEQIAEFLKVLVPFALRLKNDQD